MIGLVDDFWYVNIMGINSSDGCEANSQLDKVSWTQFVQVYFIEFKMEEDIGHDPMSRLFLNIMTIVRSSTSSL